MKVGGNIWIYGEIIYEKRKERKLSQEDLGEKLGVSRQAVSKWETNETVPDLENLKKLATILEFSIDEVLEIDIKKENEDDDDDHEYLIIGGLIVGTAISMVLKDYYILGTAFAFVGLGLGYIIDYFKKKK